MRNPTTAVGEDLDEHPVQAQVAGDLRMEGRGEDVPLAHGDDPTGGRAVLDRGEGTGALPGLLDPRRADEDRVHRALRAVRDPVDDEVRLEGGDLAAEGVAAHRDVEAAEGLLTLDPAGDPVGEQDHPGARAVGRQAGPDRVLEGLEEVEDVQQLVDRRRLPAGDDDAVHPAELGRPAHRHAPRPRGLEGRDVLAHVALQGQHADGGGGGSGHERRFYGRLSSGA
ncbi:MAG: hypothetical protein JWP95_2328 [Actinotalea sp.]|nr:hypothetical protein [Actinotalea sp.]